MHKSTPLIVLLFTLAACSGNPAVDCRNGADCASGVCRADGTCEPVSEGGGAGGSGGEGGGEGGGEAGGEGGSTGGGTGGASNTCLPNHDGVIERSEVYFQPGLQAKFVVSGAAGFDTRGDGGVDDGHWDFTGALNGDATRLVETKALTGQWFASDFPDGGYFTELGQGSDLLAVFSTDDTGLYLQGVVSPSDGLSSTRLKYQPWVKVLQFPLTQGAQWNTNAEVSGRYNGLYIGVNLPFQDELYEMHADAHGEAVTPFAAFDVLRVRTTVTRSFPFTVLPNVTLRSFSWNSECFGTVATVSAEENESNLEFTQAAEVRRLSP